MIIVYNHADRLWKHGMFPLLDLDTFEKMATDTRLAVQIDNLARINCKMECFTPLWCVI